MKVPPARRALTYVRISADRVGAGLGVGRQEADCRALAERLGWSVVDTMIDNDVSAYSGRVRPGYRRMLADLEAGRADAVLCWHTDRLHRAPKELEAFIDLCEAHDVVVHTVTAGPLDLSTPAGRMQARIVGAVARHESEHKSSRIKRQREQAAEAGLWVGGPRPYGFEADGVTQRPAEAEVIRKAIEALVAGASLSSVTREANSSGLLTTFKREDWARNSFRAMLLRPRNAGLRMHRGEVVGKAQWKPIVSEEQWKAVVKILTDPGRTTNNGGNRVRWFGSGLFVCGACGGKMWVSTSGARRSPVYRCRVTGGGGHVTRIAAPLDDFVSDLIVVRLARPDAVKLLKAKAPKVDLNVLRTEATAARRQLLDVAAAFGDGEMTRAEHNVARARAQARVDRAEEAVTAATIPSALEGLAGDPDVADVWPGLDLGRRRAVLDTLMTVTVLTAPVKGGRGGFDTAGVHIEWKV